MQMAQDQHTNKVMDSWKSSQFLSYVRHDTFIASTLAALHTRSSNMPASQRQHTHALLDTGCNN